MTFRHVLVSLAVTCLCACSSDDTIVSLNVTASDRVPVVDHMQVNVKQGSHSYSYQFTPPKETPKEGEESIQNSFFERITLPGDWDEEPASVSVEAFQKSGAPFDPPLVDETQVTIRPDGVVAAYVKLDLPEEPPPMDGGGGDGAGGAAAGGAPASEGGAPGSEGGAPASEGGVPGVAGGAAGAGGGE